MFSFLTNPSTATVVEVYIALAVYSAAVQNLPSPSTYGGVWYKAIYGFLSILASDFKSFAASLPAATPLVESIPTVQSQGNPPVV